MSVKLQTMLEAGVHLGHKKRYRNSSMDPYIYGTHYGIHIIDLEQTKELFNQALRALHQLATKGGNVLFVGTKYAAQHLIEQAAQDSGMPYVNNRWLGGMLTNYKTIRNSIKSLDDLDVSIESGKFNSLTKKEKLMALRKREKLVYNVGGIRKMKGLPDALFVVDVKEERIAITEAKKLGIPVIGIVDTNSSPEDVDYIIPGNDDSVAAIKFYLDNVVEQLVKGREKYLADQPAKPKSTVVTKKARATKESPAKPAKKATKQATKPTEKASEVVESKDESKSAKTTKAAAAKTTKTATAEKKKAVAKKPATEKAADSDKKPAKTTKTTKKASVKKDKDAAKKED